MGDRLCLALTLVTLNGFRMQTKPITNGREIYRLQGFRGEVWDFGMGGNLIWTHFEHFDALSVELFSEV